MTYLKQHILYPLLYYKKRILSCLFATILIGWMVVYCDVTQAQIDAASGLAGVIFAWIDEIFGVASLDEAKSLLNITFQNGTIVAGGYTFTSLATVLTKASTVFKNLGVMMLFAFFGINFMEGVTIHTQMIAEQIIRRFVFLIIGLILIGNALDLTFGIANIFTVVSEKMLSSPSMAQDVDSQVFALKQSMYVDMGLDEASTVPIVGGIIDAMKPYTAPLKYVLEMLIPYLLSKLANVIVSVVCWTRFVQILIMGVVCPVTLCDFGDHPSQSAAMRGAKNIVALGLSGPLILLSMFICREIQLQIMTSATASLTASSYIGAIWSMSVIAIVQISLVTRSSSLAKQALGMA